MDLPYEQRTMLLISIIVLFWVYFTYNYWPYFRSVPNFTKQRSSYLWCFTEEYQRLNWLTLSGDNLQCL